VSLGFVPLQEALVLASTCLKVSDYFVAMFWMAILRWDQCKRHDSALSADGIGLCVKRIDAFESHQAILYRYFDDDDLLISSQMTYYDSPLWSPQSQSEKEMIDWLEREIAQDWVWPLLKQERDDYDYYFFSCDNKDFIF